MKNQKTKWVILGLLTIKPFSGYDIKKLIATSVSHFWSESSGQLYPTLSLLEKEQLIVVEKIAEKGKKQKHKYSITEKGQKALIEWLQTTTEQKNTHRDEELLKLFFAKNTPKEIALTILKNREQRVREKLTQYIAIQNEIENSKSPHLLFWSLNLKNGIAHAKAEIDWCIESKIILENA